jgi:hypothetical protein
MLNSEHKLKVLSIRDNLSSLFKDLGDILVTEDNSDLDDIMQRIGQMKIEINDLINDYNIKEEN